ncbi:CoA-binding protein [Miltoncostaea marina]|uniref:CoA-binding protein n=1 Tax=Miltoncostaea marina TaxID=2843215 RepID=UPI001C3C9E77|nr:CoA-binding protein [Miltoncostaea marina]
MARFAGMADGAPSDEVRRILERHRRIAMVGLSPREDRPSHRVMVHMRAQGYAITPVNPTCDAVDGLPCAASLDEAAERGPLGIVNVFRRAVDIPPVVDDAIRLGAEVVWLQLGLREEGSAARAAAAGLQVVQDRCIKIEHCRFFGGLDVVGLSTGVIGSRRMAAFRP